MRLQAALHDRCLTVLCMLVPRMDPDLTHGQLEPVASNPFRLEPLLRNHTYPLPAWHNLMDKEVLRTFIAVPFIIDKVTLPSSRRPDGDLLHYRLQLWYVSQLQEIPVAALHIPLSERTSPSKTYMNRQCRILDARPGHRSSCIG